MTDDPLIIRGIRTMVLRVPLADPVRDSQSLVESWWLVVAIVETQNGITGWGYNAGITPGVKAVKTLIDEAIAPQLIGRDARRVRELWDRSYVRPYVLGEAGIVFPGVAAVEIAMWDIIAKSQERPLWRVFGEKGRAKIPVYNTDVGWLSYSADEAAERSARAIDSGFCGVKIKVGGEPSFDASRVRQVRAAIGEEARLLVDANCKWDERAAYQSMQRLEEYGLHCLEEPLHPFDVAAHSRLAARVGVPLMVGESITSTEMFRDFIAAHAVGILQPDALKLGGISSWLTAAALAPEHGLQVIPAVWDMMQIHIHLCAGMQEVLMMEYIPWILHLFERPVQLDDGFLRVPQEPGIGTEIRRAALEKYAVC